MEILLRSLIDHCFLCFDDNTDTWCQLPCTGISRRQTKFCVIQFFEKSIWKIHCLPTVLRWEAPSHCEGVAWQERCVWPRLIMLYKTTVAQFFGKSQLLSICYSCCIAQAAEGRSSGAAALQWCLCAVPSAGVQGRDCDWSCALSLHGFPSTAVHTQ